MGYFDANNSEHQELANAHNTGNYDRWSPDQLLQHYQNFLQTEPEDQVQQVHQDYFNQMPKAQQMSLFSGLIDAVRGQQGGNFDPSQAGVSTTDPRQASPFDLGNLYNFAANSGLLNGLLGGGGSQGGLSGILGGNQQQPNYQQQQPNYNSNQQGGLQGLQGLLSNPLAQAAISGLIGYAANRAISGFSNRGQQTQQPSQNNSSQGQAQAQNYGGGSALPGFEDTSRQS